MPSRSAVLDRSVVGAGAVLLVAGFLPWWQLEVTPGGVALGPLRGSTAWDTSPAWWLPVLAGTVTGGLWFFRRGGRLAPRWLPPVTALVGVIGVGLLAGRWFTLSAGGGGDFGWYAYAPVAEVPAFRGTPGVGLWLAAAALAVQAVAAAITVRRHPQADGEPAAGGAGPEPGSAGPGPAGP